MSFLHCMICFTFYNNTTKFYISSCLHVACMKCVERGAFTLKCKVCQKENPQCYEIGNGLKKEYRELFTPMAESVKEISTTISQVLQFQHTQRKMLLNQLYSRFENFEKMRQFCEESVKRKNEYKTQIMQLQQYNTKAKEYIQSLQSKVEELTKKPPQNTRASNMNLTSMTHDPFRTPAPRGLFRSFTTSTPCDSTIRPERGNSTSDASMSFNTAMGLPRNMNSTDGDITMLANRTEGFNIDCTLSGGVKRSIPKNVSRETTTNTSNRSCMFTPGGDKSSGFKKIRMDMSAKTDPLHK